MIVFRFLLSVLVLIIGITVAHAQPVKSSTVSEKNIAPMPLPKELVAKWEGNGAKVGWLREFPEEGLLFERSGKMGDIPAFLFDSWRMDMLTTLPTPDSAFGLFLANTKITDPELKQLQRFKNLTALYLHNTTITDAGLKALVPLANLRVLVIEHGTVTEAGLEHLAGMKLRTFRFTQGRITDRGLKHYLAAIQPPTRLDLRGTRVSDQSIALISGLRTLKHLSLPDSVTDKGLRGLSGSKLQTLYVGSKAQTNVGLRHYVAAIAPPEKLDLTAWEINDAGLKELSRLKSVTELILNRTPVSDEGMKELDSLSDLETLSLSQTRVAGTGLSHLAGLARLTHIDLRRTPTTDEAIPTLASLVALETINLAETHVTGTGFGQLSALKKLRKLNLFRTKLQGNALKELATLQALRELNLGECGGVTDVHLRDLTGLRLSVLGMPHRAMTDLGLKQYLSIVESPSDLKLAGWKLTDAGIKELAGLNSVVNLDIRDTAVTDEGLKAVKTLKNLKHLNVEQTKVTDVGLAELAGQNLIDVNVNASMKTDVGLKYYLAAVQPRAELDLHQWQITDAGLSELSAWKNLQTLSLSFTKVSDKGVKELAKILTLQTLDLRRTNVTDLGAIELAQMKGLRLLYLDGTQVTKKGHDELTRLLPNCRVER